MSPTPGLGPRFLRPGLRDPGDPVPDADPWSRTQNLVILSGLAFFDLLKKIVFEINLNND